MEDLSSNGKPVAEEVKPMLAVEIDIITPSWSEIYVFYTNQSNVMTSMLRTFITSLQSLISPLATVSLPLSG